MELLHEIVVLRAHSAVYGTFFVFHDPEQSTVNPTNFFLTMLPDRL